MPLLYQKEVSSSQTLGIWELAEQPAELLALLGNDNALADGYQGINHEWRKRQWLASRVLLSTIMLGCPVSIRYDSYNKPYIPGSEIKISISHSYDLVAVIADRSKETGIDIEFIKPKIERIADKFMSSREIRALDVRYPIESLYVHWCAKEALYKLYGKKEIFFKKNLRVEPFSYEGKGMITGSIISGSFNETYRLHYEKTGEHMLVYVLNT